MFSTSSGRRYFCVEKVWPSVDFILNMTEFSSGLNSGSYDIGKLKTVTEIINSTKNLTNKIIVYILGPSFNLNTKAEGDLRQKM